VGALLQEENSQLLGQITNPVRELDRLLQNFGVGLVTVGTQEGMIGNQNFMGTEGQELLTEFSKRVTDKDRGNLPSHRVRYFEGLSQQL
jgi:hypothetical protein